MFSLRSNSIESRFRSIRRGNFLVNIFVLFQKQKQDQKHYEFASLISFLLAMLGLGSKLGKFAPMRDALPCR